MNFDIAHYKKVTYTAVQRESVVRKRVGAIAKKLEESNPIRKELLRVAKSQDENIPDSEFRELVKRYLGQREYNNLLLYTENQ